MKRLWRWLKRRHEAAWLAHIDSGARCLVAHFGADGELLPSCIKCRLCGMWIRPKDMGWGCVGRLRLDEPCVDVPPVAAGDDGASPPGVPAAAIDKTGQVGKLGA